MQTTGCDLSQNLGDHFVVSIPISQRPTTPVNPNDSTIAKEDLVSRKRRNTPNKSDDEVRTIVTKRSQAGRTQFSADRVIEDIH
jgi:hypothetical protein